MLDELPDNQVPVNSPKRIKRVLVNAYPGASAMMLDEYSSDNIADNGTIVTNFNYLTDEVAYWKTINEYGNYEGLEYVWAYNYSAIGHANEALEAIVIVVNILLYFHIPIADFLIAIKDMLPETLYDVVAKIMREAL